MKKGLLFALALGFGSFAIAQNQTHFAAKAGLRKTNEIAIEQLSNTTNAPVQTNKSNKGTLTGVTLGYSNNVYTMLVEQQSCLSVNEGLGLIQFVHRTKVGEDYSGTTAASSGDIATTYSTDGGTTWTGIMDYPNSNPPGNNRYPSGVIYNPTGNTNPMNAYTAYIGPVHDGTAWSMDFVGSRKFNNTMDSNMYLPIPTHTLRNGFTSNSSSKIRAIGASYQGSSTSPYTLDSVYLLTGTFNSTNSNFDWTVETFNYDFVVDTDGGDAASVWYFNTAWSNDGNTGYMWTIGRHQSNDLRSKQPLVWKTTDAGANWAMMPVFDFSSFSIMNDYLIPMAGVTPATVRAHFSSSLDGVVDANDQLHLMAYVQSSYSNHNDSLDYFWSHKSIGNGSDPIFDFYTTASGWNAIHLGDIYTFSVDGADGGFGDIGWDLRLQAGKTTDGNKVFASWTDSDTTLAPDNASGVALNMFPDLYVAAYDIVSGKQTVATNFTYGTSFYGDFFFHYMSDIIITDNGTFKIPVTKIIKGTGPVDPITHVYVQGVEFTTADFITNPGFKASIDNMVSVSQNRPNPFNGNTQIDVNLDKASNLSIEVINITGQTVYSMNYGQKAQGTHTLDFNSSNLSSGIYFYTVTAGNSKVTKKMIVR